MRRMGFCLYVKAVRLRGITDRDGEGLEVLRVSVRINVFSRVLCCLAIFDCILVVFVGSTSCNEEP